MDRWNVRRHARRSSSSRPGIGCGVGEVLKITLDIVKDSKALTRGKAYRWAHSREVRVDVGVPEWRANLILGLDWEKCLRSQDTAHILVDDSFQSRVHGRWWGLRPEVAHWWARRVVVERCTLAVGCVRSVLAVVAVWAHHYCLVCVCWGSRAGAWDWRVESSDHWRFGVGLRGSGANGGWGRVASQWGRLGDKMIRIAIKWYSVSICFKWCGNSMRYSLSCHMLS